MKLRFLNIDQKLHRIENMLDYENELTDEQFRNTEEALDRYHSAELIYKADHNDYVCVDHLHAQALIYEILGKYEDAIRYVDLQIKFLKDEWNITEGAAVDELVNEKQRLIDLTRK